MTYDEAVEYLKTEAEPHGMTREVLKFFNDDVQLEKVKKTDKINYLRLANDALYDWDI